MKSIDLYKLLKEKGYSFFSGVPCSYFISLLNNISRDETSFYFVAPNEGLAVSFAAGAYLGGKNVVVIMQNSGLGNAINPLSSLCIPFGIPMLFFISGRAYGIEDEPQHKIIGKAMRKILESLSISAYDLPKNDTDAYGCVKRAHSESIENRKLVALVVKKDVLEHDENSFRHFNIPHYKWKNIFIENEYKLRMSRTTALCTIVGSVNQDVVVISTTGTSSRELFAIQDRTSHFYMQGSMGHAAGIGLGVACSTDKKVVVIDGDGALLMHMGVMSSIGHYRPKNLVHIVIDNESYESTGGQPTTSGTVDFSEVAFNCDYRNSAFCTTASKLSELVKTSLINDGPNFIHVKVSSSEIPKASRITEKISPHQLTERFCDFLRR